MRKSVSVNDYHAMYVKIVERKLVRSPSILRKKLGRVKHLFTQWSVERSKQPESSQKTIIPCTTPASDVTRLIWMPDYVITWLSNININIFLISRAVLNAGETVQFYLRYQLYNLTFLKLSLRKQRFKYRSEHFLSLSSKFYHFTRCMFSPLQS